jgi:REP element-mobilizing transposase RayT
MHLTIKVEKRKAGLKNKSILKVLKRAILKGRSSGLRIIHFTLEYDHVHLLVESDCKIKLGRGMMRFGVTLAKGINKFQKGSGQVYKHRYHQRFINSGRDLKNVLNYIFKNGLKHKTASTLVNPFNSIRAEVQHFLMKNRRVIPDWELIRILDRGKIHFNYLN